MGESTSHSKAFHSFDKRNVALFIVLVVIALACLGFIVSTLFFARPRTDPQIEKSSHSSELRALPLLSLTFEAEP